MVQKRTRLRWHHYWKSVPQNKIGCDALGRNKSSRKVCAPLLLCDPNHANVTIMCSMPFALKHEHFSMRPECSRNHNIYLIYEFSSELFPELSSTALHVETSEHCFLSTECFGWWHRTSTIYTQKLDPNGWSSFTEQRGVSDAWIVLMRSPGMLSRQGATMFGNFLLECATEIEIIY